MVDVDLHIAGEEVGDGEGREDGEGVSWERWGGEVQGEVLSLDTHTKPGSWRVGPCHKMRNIMDIIVQGYTVEGYNSQRIFYDANYTEVTKHHV